MNKDVITSLHEHTVQMLEANKALIDQIRVLKVELACERVSNKSLRGYYAASVTKECKCERNIAVNIDVVKRNIDLKADLKSVALTIKQSIARSNNWECECADKKQIAFASFLEQYGEQDE